MHGRAAQSSCKRLRTGSKASACPSTPPALRRERHRLHNPRRPNRSGFERHRRRLARSSPQAVAGHCSAWRCACAAHAADVVCNAASSPAPTGPLCDRSRRKRLANVVTSRSCSAIWLVRPHFRNSMPRSGATSSAPISTPPRRRSRTGRPRRQEARRRYPCLFGYPLAHENDAERAVHAALAIQRALAD